MPDVDDEMPQYHAAIHENSVRVDRIVRSGRFLYGTAKGEELTR